MDGKETRSFSGPDEKSLKETNPSRRTILGIMTAAAVGVGLWLYGSAIVGKGPETSPTAERNDAMALTQKNPVRNAVIPPLDAAAPAKTETATFALG